MNTFTGSSHLLIFDGLRKEQNLFISEKNILINDNLMYKLLLLLHCQHSFLIAIILSPAFAGAMEIPIENQ